jgi:hypothetical protein
MRRGSPQPGFFYDAPLESHANPLQTPLHTKAPWYFWFLQGMLKIGDKTLWGVVIPTVMFVLVLLVPYTDDPNINPFSHTSRLATRRKFSNAMGIVTAIIMVVFSFMGTPLYGVKATPPVEVVQEFLPEEGKAYQLETCKRIGGCDGGIRAIPYDELPIGLYDTRDKSTWPGGLLGTVMGDYEEEIHKLLSDDPTAYGTVQVTQAQTNLKRLQMTVYFTDAESGEEGNHFIKSYYHEEIHYEGF